MRLCTTILVESGRPKWAWVTAAPLAWDVEDPGPVADAINFLLSDASRAITAEILHVDGGFHAMGTDLLSKEEQARLAAEDG